MNVVCNTNVLISGILFGGHARQILRLVSRGKLTNFISPEILREAEEVLSRPKFGLRPDQVLNITALFRDTFELVIPERRVATIKADPADNRILEAAEVAEAEFIISGDRHLLDLCSWRGIRIVSPAGFIKAYTSA